MALIQIKKDLSTLKVSNKKLAIADSILSKGMDTWDSSGDCNMTTGIKVDQYGAYLDCIFSNWNLPDRSMKKIKAMTKTMTINMEYGDTSTNGCNDIRVEVDDCTALYVAMAAGKETETGLITSVYGFYTMTFKRSMGMGWLTNKDREWGYGQFLMNADQIDALESYARHKTLERLQDNGYARAITYTD